MSKWKIYIKGYKSFLQLEKSLSQNSVEAYLNDLNKLIQFLEMKAPNVGPKDLNLNHLKNFVQWVNDIGLSARSQARIISGIKGFYKYLLIENIITKDPTAMLESPRIGRKLPDTLSVEEIDSIISNIDMSKPEGLRNKAILETLMVGKKEQGE